MESSRSHSPLGSIRMENNLQSCSAMEESMSKLIAIFLFSAWSFLSIRAVKTWAFKIKLYLHVRTFKSLCVEIISHICGQISKVIYIIVYSNVSYIHYQVKVSNPEIVIVCIQQKNEFTMEQENNFLQKFIKFATFLLCSIGRRACIDS